MLKLNRQIGPVELETLIQLAKEDKLSSWGVECVLVGLYDLLHNRSKDEKEVLEWLHNSLKGIKISLDGGNFDHLYEELDECIAKVAELAGRK